MSQRRVPGRRARLWDSSARVIARRVIEHEARTLVELARRVGKELDAAVELCLACQGRVVLTGMGKSGLICRKVSATLASTGTASLFLHPADALHGDLGMLREGDVLCAVSNSGSTEEILKIVPAVKRLGIPILLVTGTPASKLGRLADIVLHVPVEKEADPFGFIPTASTTGAMAVGDALAVALLVKRGFREEDFHRNHPGGSLGRRFLKVRDVMHTGERIPRVSPSTTVRKALPMMSAKRFGMTAVVDGRQRIAGILTDGDVRRMLSEKSEASVLDRPIGECMTRAPKCIDPDELLPLALHMLEAFHITSLLVADPKRRLVGVLHLHDLWKTELF